MLRDKNLIPLSHQHQHALALCVRIERASPIADADVVPWQDEIAQQFKLEIAIHFAAEEDVLFPEAKRFEELGLLVENLLSDHADLRARFGVATSGRMTGNDVLALAQRLSAHIRKEERQLFERLQQLLTGAEMAVVGARLEKTLEDAVQACAVPKKRS